MSKPEVAKPNQGQQAPKPQQAMTQAPSTAVGLPSYIQPSNEGLEQVENVQLGIPMVKVVQKTSKEIDTAEASFGDFIDAQTKEKLPDGIKGVVIAMQAMRYRWKPSPAVGMDCFSKNGQTAFQPNGICGGSPTNKCAECDYAKFGEKPDGSIKKPDCTEYLDFLILFEGRPVPMVLAMGSSQMKQAKKLAQRLYADISVKNVPIYSFLWAFSTKKEQKGNNTWAEVVITPAGYADEDMFNKAKGLYQEFSKVLQTVNHQQDETSSVDPAGAPVL